MNKAVKASLITAAVLAFVPTVFVKNKDKGFDGYGILSHLKYEKTTDENGKVNKNFTFDLIDLSRYTKKETVNNEDNTCIEEQKEEDRA